MRDICQNKVNKIQKHVAHRRHEGKEIIKQYRYFRALGLSICGRVDLECILGMLFEVFERAKKDVKADS